MKQLISMQILLIPILSRLGNTVAQEAPHQAGGILKHSPIAVSFKHLRNFWRSLKMPLINCKVELRLKWTECCVLSANGNDNVNVNDNTNNIIFAIKELYVPAVTLSTRDNQKLSKFLSKEFERSVYWNEDKATSENKNTTNEYR